MKRGRKERGEGRKERGKRREKRGEERGERARKTYNDKEDGQRKPIHV